MDALRASVLGLGFGRRYGTLNERRSSGVGLESLGVGRHSGTQDEGLGTLFGRRLLSVGLASASLGTVTLFGRFSNWLCVTSGHKTHFGRRFC